MLPLQEVYILKAFPSIVYERTERRVCPAHVPPYVPDSMLGVVELDRCKSRSPHNLRLIHGTGEMELCTLETRAA